MKIRIKKLLISTLCVMLLFWTEIQCADDTIESDSSANSIKVKFLNIQDSNGNISINGLLKESSIPQSSIDEGVTYQIMIDKMTDKVSKMISKGWKSSNHNQYTNKSFSFSNCDFDKKLLEDVGDELSRYKMSINPSVHFYECHFEAIRLRSTFSNKSGIAKKSFLECTEGPNRAKIPNTKK